MKKASLEMLASLPPVLKDYRDASGYVFLDCPVADAQEGWTELTPEERDGVRPLTTSDARQWDAWHARKGSGGDAA